MYEHVNLADLEPHEWRAPTARSRPSRHGPHRGRATVGWSANRGSAKPVTRFGWNRRRARTLRRRSDPVWRTGQSHGCPGVSDGVRTADEGSGFITIDAATVDRSRLPASLETTADDRTLAKQFVGSPKEGPPGDR
ncbi:hypothetical protein C9J85_11325 [Haloferax sp. wsp5]|nr:hypothetical protein C9J85_11325 [Haloferax sp. wsp5]